MGVKEVLPSGVYLSNYDVGSAVVKDGAKAISRIQHATDIVYFSLQMVHELSILSKYKYCYIAIGHSFVRPRPVVANDV